MQRAFYLAWLGRESVAPNPRVGCVLAKRGRIIGEGWHARFGGPHAETHALRGVSAQDVKNADVYVTLEPCAHHGKTPPCVKQLIEARVGRVFIAIRDSNPASAGGAEQLQAAGIRVQANTHPHLGYWINRRFFTLMRKKRPYIILKWAQTADGYMASGTRARLMISNPYSEILSHGWRAHEDAIVVGYRTALHDNPQLTTRLWMGKNPLRVLLDERGTLPHTHQLLNDGHPTRVYLTRPRKNTHTATYRCVPATGYLQHAIKHLGAEGVSSLLVEGGCRTLHSLIGEDLWDEIRIIQSPWALKEKGLLAPIPPKSPATIQEQADIQGDRLLWIGRSTHTPPPGLGTMSRLF